jgi:hypothetical protein
MATKKKAASSTTTLALWQEKFMASAKAGAEQLKNIGGGGTGIKFGHGTIQVGDAVKKDGKIEVIIVGYTGHNRWFKGKYDPSETTPPDCYAFSAILGDEAMAPHPAASDKQSTLCIDCPKNAWGSADTGRGKACANTVRLGCLLASDIDEAKDVAGAELATAGVSPTNLAKFKSYVNELADRAASDGGPRPTWGVITQIQSFHDDKTQIRLEFTLVSDIEDAAILEALEKRLNKVQDTLQQPYQATAEKVKAGARKKFAGKVPAKKGK